MTQTLIIIVTAIIMVDTTAMGITTGVMVTVAMVTAMFTTEVVRSAASAFAIHGVVAIGLDVAFKQLLFSAQLKFNNCFIELSRLRRNQLPA